MLKYTKTHERHCENQKFSPGPRFKGEGWGEGGKEGGEEGDGGEGFVIPPLKFS